jgi:mannose-6-phosphate isomerase-like protein (cupin superfamily)
MPEALQFFKYNGPDADGGRDTAEGRRSYPMAKTDNVVSTVQIFQKGVGNRLHVHLTEDGYWFVLGGRVRFWGPGETVIAELGQHEGLLMPAGNHYWFEGISDEPLQILRVNYRVHDGPRHGVDDTAGHNVQPAKPDWFAARV